jgi:hypothetical protein
MNTGGFSIVNYHDGNTSIDGDLTVSGNFRIGGADGITEYLDSGDYKTVVTPSGVAWNALVVTPGTTARYAKNGNIVQFYTTLRGSIKANQPSAVLTLTVPGVDIFGVEKIPLTYATCVSIIALTDGSMYYGSIANVQTIGSSTGIILFYARASGSNIVTTTDFDVLITYKLTGDDIPATALVVGGGGGTPGSGVQNPLLSTLNGGGFDLTNFGNIEATTFNGGEILTNPLSSNFNAAGFHIYNASLVSTDSLGSNTDNPFDVLSSIDMKANSILNCTALASTDIVNDTIYLKRIIKNSLISVEEIQVEKIRMLENINMDNNSLENVNVLTTNTITSDQASIAIGKSIDFNSSGSIIGAIDIRTNSIGLNDAKEITINANVSLSGNTLFGCQDVISTKIEAEIVDITNKLELFGVGVITNAVSTQTAELKVSNIKSDTEGVPTAPVNMLNILNMNNNAITNVGSMSGFTATGTIDMAANALINAAAISSTGSINGGSLNASTINGVKYIRTIADIPSGGTFAGIYVVCAIITLTTATFTTSGDTVFIGYDASAGALTGFIFADPSPGASASFCFTSTAHNVSFINMRISNLSATKSLFSFNDLGQTKKLTMMNTLFINCKNQSVVHITGYDLVNISQTVFEFCNPTTDHLTIIASYTIQISNCTLFKSYDPALTPPNGAGTAPLISLGGISNSVNITGTIINTISAQDGIRVDNAFDARKALIGGNTFYSAASTGQLLNYDVSFHPNLQITGNAGIKSNRARLAIQSENNGTYTPTIVGEYTPILFGNPEFRVTADYRFMRGPGFSFIYIGDQPIDVTVNGSFSCDHLTGGTDLVRIALIKNNITDISIPYSEVFLLQGTIKTIGLNNIMSLNINDVVEFQCRNYTAGTETEGFRCFSFNATITEI